MALSALRLRRTLTLTSSSLIRRYRLLSSLSSSSSSYILQSQMISSPPSNPRKNYMKTQISWFRSSLLCLSSRSSYNNNHDDPLSPDTILFEGCDYNHWLITMEFPKDPKPTPEEMVETYVQTLAKVVGSVEEAKKRMYACSTTTYNGFQAVMTEEMSEKFRGLPGVVFILPDSYIDPVNKEYGGDKYINGTIIPRPPPVQYGRQNRYGDRNRRQGSPQGDERNYGVQQTYGPPQNSGPAAPGDGRNYGAQQNYGPPQNSGPVAPRDGRNYGVQQKYGPPQNSGPAAPGDGRNYGAQQNYSPQQNMGPNPTGQGEERSFGAQQSYASQQNYAPRPTGPGEHRDNFAPEKRDFRGDNRNLSPSPAGDYRQGAGSSYGQSYPGHGEGQRFQQTDDIQGEQRNFTPLGQRKNDQGRVDVNPPPEVVPVFVAEKATTKITNQSSGSAGFEGEKSLHFNQVEDPTFETLAIKILGASKDTQRVSLPLFAEDEDGFVVPFSLGCSFRR